MNQADYNALPLLLLHRQVVAALPELTHRALYEFRRDGDLRTFQPDPDRPFAYYYKVDVGRIHGRLALEMDWLDALEEWVESGPFCTISGLCREALDRACGSRQLVAVRWTGSHGHRRFYSRDLEWFL